MHELSIAQGILEIVQQYVPEERAGGIRSVKVRVGQLSGVVAESLDFSFGAIVAGTSWRNAKLNLERVPAVSDCNGCGGNFEIRDYAFCCPACSSTDIRIVSGTELQVVEIEFDEGSESQ
jgi:hydrogenase nickel incorporation protein HypA/HybF